LSHGCNQYIIKPCVPNFKNKRVFLFFIYSSRCGIDESSKKDGLWHRSRHEALEKQVTIKGNSQLGKNDFWFLFISRLSLTFSKHFAKLNLNIEVIPYWYPPTSSITNIFYRCELVGVRQEKNCFNNKRAVRGGAHVQVGVAVAWVKLLVK
jgi:hypothetical protein